MGNAVSTLTMADLKTGDAVTVICSHNNIVAEIKITHPPTSSLCASAVVAGRQQDGIQHFSVNDLLGTPWQPRNMVPTALAREQFASLVRADAKDGCACRLERTVRKGPNDRR